MKKYSVTRTSAFSVHKFVVLATDGNNAREISKKEGHKVSNVFEVPNYKGIIRDPRNF